MASATASSPAPPRDSSVSSTSTVGGRAKQFVNGVRGKGGNKSQSEKSSESTTPEGHSHDRLLFLLANFVGFQVAITTQTGNRYSGIFSGASLDQPDARFVLKMVKKTKDSTGTISAGATDDEPYIGFGDDHVMDFARDDMADLQVSGVTFDKAQTRHANGSAGAFKTDTDISGNRAIKARELVAWQPEADGPNSTDMSLATNGSSNWDQFEVNARLYGVQTDYDENMYTTQIDRSAPSYKERVAVAERKAREIEGAAGGSFQAREDAEDANEEARFSGVDRSTVPLSTSSNKYTAPARRAPTGKPTVPGAPVDPAIISSQLARPQSQNQSKAQPTADGQKKENLPAIKNEAKPSEAATGEGRELAPGKQAAVANQSRSPNATETVERDVLKSFKDFSAGEKMRVQEQQRKQQRRDKEVKLNDLKKFAENFRLPRAVPEDMLGILAKDKTKQEQILKKSVHDAEVKTPTKSPAVPEAPATQTATAPAARPEPPAPAPIPNEPANHRGGGASGGRGRGGPGGNRGDKAAYGQGRGGMQPGFGARKMREYGQMPHGGPTGPVGPMMPMGSSFPIQTDVPNRSLHAPTPSSATSSRFNVAANEFRPNPTASTFSPSGGASSVTSQSASRPVSKAQSPSKKSFFGGQRPKPASEHRSIHDGFNPIKRMRLEAENEGKAKDYSSNDGIPPPYTTRPTWETTPENSEKTYNDVFEKAAMPTPSMSGGMPHQHQLPLHLQQNMHGAPHFQSPQHGPRFGQSPMHQGPREQYFDDTRMQFSASQPGMYGSPRAQPGVMVQHSPMAGQVQPAAHGMPQPQVFVPGQQMPMMAFNQRPGSMPPQMMGSPGMGMPGAMPQGQQFMMPGQPGQMMYSPAPGQAYPAPGPQTPGGYPSPRPPPMMTHQGSQQGHGPPMMYANGSQQGFYMAQPGQPMNQQMRGGYPMQQQGSFGASPHMQYQHPMPGPRGPQQYGASFPQHNVPGGHGMHHPPPPTAGSDMK